MLDFLCFKKLANILGLNFLKLQYNQNYSNKFTKLNAGIFKIKRKKMLSTITTVIKNL